LHYLLFLSFRPLKQNSEILIHISFLNFKTRYGLNTNSSYHDKVLPYEANVPQEAIDNIVEAQGENWQEINAIPALCNNIYEVYLADERDICKARDDLVGKG